MTQPEPAANPSQRPAPHEGAGPTESAARPATIEPADLPIDPHGATQPMPQQLAAPSQPAAAQPTAPMPLAPTAQQPTAPPPPSAPQPAVSVPPSAPQPAVTPPTMQVPAVQSGPEAASTAQFAGAPQAYGSAPVTYPGAAYPVSSVPVSAYPVSAYPTSGYPGGYPAAAVPGAKRPIATIVLSVTVGVLVLALGVLTTLFVIKSMDLTDTRAELTGQVAERDEKIKLNATEIDSLKSQVQRTKDELAVVKRDLEGSENAAKDLTAAKAALAACLDKLTTFLASPTQANLKVADAACEAADKYM